MAWHKNRQKMTEAILVTGGAGFVGSHLCKMLARVGFMPVTYDNLLHGHETAVRWGPLVRGDITDADHLATTIRDYQIKTVCHCAALIDVAQSVRAPELFYHTNSLGMARLLQAMRMAGADRLIFSSTCAVYGVPQTALLTENHPRNPVNPYGRSKLAAEYQIEDACATGWLRAVILRYFNAAGADPEGEIGEQHNPETHAIPLAIQAALGTLAHFSVYGQDYDTPDGTAIRDYIHVMDLAQAHIAALSHLGAQDACLAVNLGTGRGYSVAEILTAISHYAGRDVPTLIQHRRAGDVPMLIADPTLAQNILGWAPQHSTLDMMIRDAWQWFAKKI